MDQDLENIIIAGEDHEDVEAAILINILGDRGNNMDQQFNLDDPAADDCRFLFRFEKDDLFRLSNSLRMPDIVRTYKGNKVSGVTGLCMVLKRLAYPNRLRDLNIFGHSPQSMALIINRVVDIIVHNHGHLLADLRRLQWLNHQRMELYSRVVQDKDAAIPNCWGFIDGTARAICRPSIDQKNYYSGHKRFHCIKYQSVLCPDGLIASLKGGWPGRRHDARIFAESGLYEELEMVAVFPNNIRYVLYGDQAYGVRELLYSPYRNHNHINLEEHQRQFNASMKVLRVAVEWGFQKVISEFAFLDFKKNQKWLLQDVESMYKAGVILTNCHTCLYGSQTAQYFNINPLELDEYIGA